MAKSEFLKTVQLHERAWGTESYAQRPSLEEMLNAKVVVFWKHGKENQWRASTHDSLAEVEQEITRMLLRINIAPPKRSVARIFGKGKRICMQKVKIKFAYCDNEMSP